MNEETNSEILKTSNTNIIEKKVENNNINNEINNNNNNEFKAENNENEENILIKSPVNSHISASNKATSTINEKLTGSVEKTEKPSALLSSQLFTKVGKTDVPAIFYLDLDTIEKKGWQEENANVSDYFNYGKEYIKY